MRNIVKNITFHSLQPLVARYLSKTRTYHHNDIKLLIPPEVFHPGFFFSTKILLRYLYELQLAGQTFLELGAGSGLISIDIAQKGAFVTATDIHPIAVQYLDYNSNANNVALRIIQSDLFEHIPVQPFEIIAINPPYYKKNPVSEKDYAWFCGEDGQYFERLFRQIGVYMLPKSVVLMILSDECDLELIKEMAGKNGFKLDLVRTKRIWWEVNFIYQLKIKADF